MSSTIDASALPKIASANEEFCISGWKLYKANQEYLDLSVNFMNSVRFVQSISPTHEMLIEQYFLLQKLVKVLSQWKSTLDLEMAKRQLVFESLKMGPESNSSTRLKVCAASNKSLRMRPPGRPPDTLYLNRRPSTAIVKP